MTSKRSSARLKGSVRGAEVGLAEFAHPANLGLDRPILADVVEVAHDETGGQAAIDLDAVVAAGLGALDDLGADVGALDADIPAGERGKVLVQEHGQAVGLLAGGAGRAPEAQAAARCGEPR